MSLDKSLQIKGWMSNTELQWLADQALTHKNIVEVGCYAGRSTRALGDHTEGSVYTLDDFLGADTERPLSPKDSKELYLECKKNLQDLIDKGKVFIFHPEDREQLTNVPDFVFIDGDHSYLAVSEDIKFWKKKMKNGGILSGHDSNHPPIAQALQELLTDVKYPPSTSIWYVEL
jgi:hypothetical protein